MSVPTDSLRSGLNFVSGHVDREGTITAIDVGRDHIHDAPLLIATWDGEKWGHDAPFVRALFGPEHMARTYTPEENVRLAYLHEPVADPDETIGDWKGATVVVDRSLRTRLRETVEWYVPDDEGIDRLRELLA